MNAQMIRKVGLVLLTLVLMLGGFGAAGQPAQAQDGGIDLQACTLLYAVQPEDTLAEIAERFDTDVEDLRALNPQLGANSEIFPGLVLCVSEDPGVVLPPTGQTPLIDIIDVDPGEDVTIHGRNFPGNVQFNVLLGEPGTRGEDGTRIATIVTPQDGDFTATFDLPERFQDDNRIVIRLESPATGFFAYNTFTNTTTGGGGIPAEDCEEFYTVRRGDRLRDIARTYDTTVERLVELNNIADPDLIFTGQRLCVAAEDDVLPPTGAQAVLRIQDVDAGDDVTVRGTGFPAGQEFDVLIGSADDDAEEGEEVATVTAPQDGQFTQTFEIPEDFQDEEDLAIRFESTTTDLVVFAEFQNGQDGDENDFPVEDGLDLPNTPAAETSAQLRSGERFTVSQGNAGVFSPESAYAGTLHLARYNPQVAGTDELQFTQQLLRILVTGQGGGQIDEVRGLVYVFFEITDDTREAFDLDELAIYRFDPDDQAWEACDIPVRIDGDDDNFDRLACVIQEFGVYGLAIEQD